MRQRTTISNKKSLFFHNSSSKKEGMIGFVPAREIEIFSFMNLKHSSIVLAIVVGMMCSTALIHWLLNDFEAVESTQKQEVQMIEDLFHSEFEWMQKNHQSTVDLLKKSHQNDVDNELKWFLDEMAVITQQKQALQVEHKGAEQELRSSSEMHGYHSREQKLLDEQLNALYSDSGDKTEHLNKKLKQCNDANAALDIKIAAAKVATPAKADVKVESVQGSDSGYQYKYYQS